MPGTGQASLTFGAHPGGTDASVAVAQPAILITSLAEAWLTGIASADHSVDEIIAEAPNVLACDIVAGVGFTIRAHAVSGSLTGAYTVSWVWV